MRFWLAVFVAVRNLKADTAVSRTHENGAPRRSLGQSGLAKMLEILRPAIRVLATVLLASSLASAQGGTPAPRPEDETSVMQLLAGKGLHDIENESWNAYGQFTYISSWKPSFDAPYTNLNGSINSLLPTAERSFTGTATVYLGARLWKGSEGYFVPELISEQPFSQLRGLGGAIQNFELQKGGSSVPQVYKSRLFVKQTVGLGGKSVVEESGPLQLGTRYDSRRLVFVAGNFSILDFFDTNAFDVDPRQGFLSLGFLTYAAYDFASDARGYSYGGIGEFHWDNWAARVGRITPPKLPNQLPVDFRLFKYYGDQVEVEHKHAIHEQEGMVRVLALWLDMTQSRGGEGKPSQPAFRGPSTPPGDGASRNDQVEWGLPAPREPRWPASMAILLAIGLQVVLPDNLTHDLGPRWLVPAFEGALGVALLIANPWHTSESRKLRPVSVGLIAVINAANLIALGALVAALLGGTHAGGRSLVYASVPIWLTNV